MNLSNEAIGNFPIITIQPVVLYDEQKLPFPNEILCQIIQKIPFNIDKLNLSLSCRQIHKIVFNEERYSHRNEIQLFISVFESYVNQEVLDYQKEMLKKFEDSNCVTLYEIEKTASEIKLETIKSFYKHLG